MSKTVIDELCKMVNSGWSSILCSPGHIRSPYYGLKRNFSASIANGPLPSNDQHATRHLPETMQIDEGSNSLVFPQNPLFSMSFGRLRELVGERKNLAINDKDFYFLCLKSFEKERDLELFIELLTTRTFDLSTKNLTVYLMELHRKRKNILILYDILVEFLSGKPEGMQKCFDQQFFKYVISGLSFGKHPLKALQILEGYIELFAPSNESEFFQDCWRSVSIGFAVENTDELVDVFWDKTVSRFNEMIPIKIMTVFLNHFHRNEKEDKVMQIYSLSQRITERYDARFYNELCFAFLKMKKNPFVQELLLKCPYGEIDSRIIRYVLDNTTREEGVSVGLRFAKNLFEVHRGKISFYPESFVGLCREVGRLLHVKYVKFLLQLFEHDGKVSIDNNLVTELYRGIKSVKIQHESDHVRLQECIDFLKEFCKERNLSIQLNK